MVRCSICVVGCSMFEIEQVSERKPNWNWEIQSETERTWKVNKVQETCVSVIELLNISQNEQWFDCFCTHINTIIGMQLNTQISLALPLSFSLSPYRNDGVYHEKVYVFEEKPQSTNKARLFLSHFWSFSFTGSGFGLTPSRNYWEIVWWVCREFLYRMSLRLCFFGAGTGACYCYCYCSRPFSLAASFQSHLPHQTFYLPCWRCPRLFGIAISFTRFLHIHVVCGSFWWFAINVICVSGLFWS